MKLQKLHIEGFGKLRRYDCTFRDGLNSLLAENGWGKTTLTVFLKAMLCGIRPEERERYRPKQGGDFGGTIELELHGKRYRITRSFGETPDADTLQITDAAAGTPADPLLLGGIPEEVFAQSLSVTQEALRAGSTDIRETATEQVQEEITQREAALTALTQEITAQEAQVQQLEQTAAAQAQSREALQQLETQLADTEAQLTAQQERLQQRIRLDETEEQLRSLTAQQEALARVLGGMPDAAKLEQAAALQQQASDLAQEQERLAKTLAAVEERCGGTLPETSLPASLQQLSDKRQTLLTELTQLTEAAKSIPDTVQAILSAGEDFPERLQTAVSSGEALRAVAEKLDETDRSLREEQALWEEKRAGFLTLHQETAALQSETDAQPENSPEVIEPVMASVEALQERCTGLQQQIEECEQGCIEAERLWGDRQQRYALMREEVDRMQADLDQHSGYNTEEVKKTVAQISDMQKRRTRLSEDERMFKESLSVETIRWEEQHKHYDELHAAAERLAETAKTTAQYDSELSDPMQRLLEATQEAEQELVYFEAESERCALLTEEKEQLKAAPKELPEAELCMAVIQKSRKLVLLRSDIEDLQTKQQANQEQLTTLRASAEADAPLPEEAYFVAGTPVGLILLVIGILVAVTGVILGLAVAAPLFAAAAAGVVCAVIGIVLHVRRRQAIAAAAAKKAEHTRIMGQRIALSKAEADEAALSEKEQELTAELADCEAAVDDWCKKWFPQGDAASLVETAERFRALRELQDKAQHYQSLIEQTDALHRQIDGNLQEVYAQYPELQGKPTAEAYTILQQGEADHRIACRERDTAKENLRTWLKSCGYDENMELSEDGRSPKIVHIEEQIAAVQRAWEALDAEKEALFQRYPDMRGMDGEAALLHLTRQGEAYRLATAKKKTAERKLIAFYAETKLNADLMEQDISPEIPLLREKQASLREELQAAAEEQRTLCAQYPEAQDVPPEEAAAALQERLSKYRLQKGRIQAAAEKEAQYLAGGRFTREELLGDGSAMMQTLRQERNAAEAEQLRLTETCTAVLQTLGIPADPLTEGLHKAGACLQEYQAYQKQQQERLVRCEALQQEADALQKQQETLAGGFFPDRPMDERIRLLQETVQEASALQTQLAENTEAAAKHAAAADAFLAPCTVAGADRTERLAGYLTAAQEAVQLAGQTDALTQQQNDLQAVADTDRAALQEIVTGLTNEQAALCSRIGQEKSVIEQQTQQLAALPALTAALQAHQSQKSAAEAQLTRLRRMAALFGSGFREKLQAHTDRYLQRLPESLRSKSAGDCSSSEQCLRSLCERLALADTLFADGKPLLILDDPLLWLDEKQLAAAARILQHYAENHQILYYTCHPSRMLKRRK